MKRAHIPGALLVLSTLLLAPPAGAHHSFALFDISREETVTGTIKEFQFVNPHTITRLISLDASGQQVEYTFEGVSTGVLFRAGWRPDTLRPGDKVTIVYAPLKDGAHGGMFLHATLPDGHVLYNVGLLPGSPSYKPENLATQKETVAALRSERAKQSSQR
jgi:hypothetical protein